MDWEGDNIKIGFQSVLSYLVIINNHIVEEGPIQPTNPDIE